MNLLPCPFCASNEIEESFSMGTSQQKECKNCKARGPKTEKFNPAELWNLRHSPWISVKDRLPEEDTKILIHTKLYGITLGNLGKFLPKGMAFYCIDRGFIGHVDGNNVTHWMPLPSLPEEKP